MRLVNSAITVTSPVPTVSILQIAPIVSAFEALGLPVARILLEARIEPTSLADSSARVPLASEERMWNYAVELSGEPTLGLKVAEQLRPGATGSFEYLLRHSETLEQLLSRAARFSRLADDLAIISWECRDGVATITVARTAEHPVPYAGTECLFAVIASAARDLFPHRRPLEAHFEHTARADVATYRAVLGCPVRFAAGGNRILVPEAWLAEATSNVDGNLGKVLEQHNAHLLAQLPSLQDFLGLTRQHMRTLLERGELSLETLARALRVSERTLRRRLQGQGTSFQELLDELRRNQALLRVADETLSLEQLASSLGFAEMSSFHRAFKRWTGSTPAKYRRGSQP